MKILRKKQEKSGFVNNHSGQIHVLDILGTAGVKIRPRILGEIVNLDKSSSKAQNSLFSFSTLVGGVFPLQKPHYPLWATTCFDSEALVNCVSTYTVFSFSGAQIQCWCRLANIITDGL